MGCSGRDASDGSVESGPIALGTWRATLESPGGELPFGLDILQENGRYVAFIVNGPERIRVPEVEVADGRIEMLDAGLQEPHCRRDRRARAQRRARALHLRR